MVNNEDKRSELRVFDEIAIFLELESTPDSPAMGQVCITNTLDISANGLKVVSNTSLPLNSIHQICIEVSDRQFYLVGEVAWLAPEEHEFAIGFQLIESEGTQIVEWKEYIGNRLQSLDR